ncbi:MAG: MATE family efflux transporter [Clostridia bacterium]|nr:MATE family efflux transporter [Clostridia bacterium]
MNETFMKEKPILPLITSMALPMVISMLVNSLYNIVDSYFVAQISEGAMTAVSLVFPVQNFINAVAIGFGVGINAVIAFHLGANDAQQTNAAATRGLVLSVVHGALMTGISIAAIPAFLRMFTTDPQLVDLGVRYSRIAFAFSLVIMLNLWFEKVFQAVGAMKVSMVGMMGGCIANILMDPLLIFGVGPFPRLGIEGAALATGLGQLLTLAIYLATYLARPIRVRVERQYFARNPEMDRRLYSIGIPAVLNMALSSLLVSALNAILASYSQIYVVVLGIYYKLQTFLYLPANGIIQGIRPLVGYNFGAGEYRRVRQIYVTTLGMCGIIMALGTAVCLCVPDRLIGLFTSNPETIQAGQTALRIICAGFVVSSVSVTSCGALEGLGQGTPSLIISLCRYVIIIIPTAFALSRIGGADAVWNAFWFAETATAGIALFVYRNTARRKAH